MWKTSRSIFSLEAWLINLYTTLDVKYVQWMTFCSHVCNNVDCFMLSVSYWQKFQGNLCQSASERASRWVSAWLRCVCETKRGSEAVGNCVYTCFIFYSSQPFFAQINTDLWGSRVCDCYLQEFFTGWPAVSWCWWG